MAKVNEPQRFKLLAEALGESLITVSNLNPTERDHLMLACGITVDEPVLERVDVGEPVDDDSSLEIQQVTSDEGSTSPSVNVQLSFRKRKRSHDHTTSEDDDQPLLAGKDVEIVHYVPDSPEDTAGPSTVAQPAQSLDESSPSLEQRCRGRTSRMSKKYRIPRNQPETPFPSLDSNEAGTRSAGTSAPGEYVSIEPASPPTGPGSPFSEPSSPVIVSVRSKRAQFLVPDLEINMLNLQDNGDFPSLPSPVEQATIGQSSKQSTMEQATIGPGNKSPMGRASIGQSSKQSTMEQATIGPGNKSSVERASIGQSSKQSPVERATIGGSPNQSPSRSGSSSPSVLGQSSSYRDQLASSRQLINLAKSCSPQGDTLDKEMLEALYTPCQPLAEALKGCQAIDLKGLEDVHKLNENRAEAVTESHDQIKKFHAALKTVDFEKERVKGLNMMERITRNQGRKERFSTGRPYIPFVFKDKNTAALPEDVVNVENFESETENPGGSVRRGKQRLLLDYKEESDGESSGQDETWTIFSGKEKLEFKGKGRGKGRGRKK